MPSPTPAGAFWRTALVGALTAAILWWFLRGVDLAAVWRAIRSAHPAWIVLSLGATAGTYVLRAARWRVLLLPLGRARFGPVLRTTTIGFTVSFLLPGRLGEVVKPYLLAREEGFSPPATFATVVVERVLDLSMVLCLFALFLLGTVIDVGRAVRLAGAMSAALAATGFIGLMLGAGHPERLAAWTAGASRWLPERAATGLSRLVHTFAGGLAVMRRPGPLLGALALTLPLWLSIALSIWATSRAFDLTFPFQATFLIMMFLLGGVAVPTPGGIGSFQEAYRLAATQLLPAPALTSAIAAAAIVLWVLGVAPVSAIGLVLMAREGLTLGRLRGIGQKGGLA